MEQIAFTPKQARKYRDFSQGYISKHLGMHINTYRRFEEHPECFTVEQSIRFAEIVNMPYDCVSFCSKNLPIVDNGGETNAGQKEKTDSL
jgi:hypothetical protein